MTIVHKRYNLYYPSGTHRLQMRREIPHSSIDGQPSVAYKNELFKHIEDGDQLVPEYNKIEQRGSI